MYNKKFSTDKYYFKETPFNLLMQKRVSEILLVCSKYDKFMLDEDGRIDEQLFQEYVSLHLRYPPRFTQASTAEEAFEKLETRYFDLVITMLNIGELQAFELGKQIKEKYPNKPIVVLTHFSREISIMLEKADFSSIDYVFSWLGNTNILLAIVKLIEDSMNAEYDIKGIGSQTIILVEDSIRYYSSYLPLIYRVLFQQKHEIMADSLNEHQQMLRMRGRPKILLATNFEEAMDLYNKYKDNLLGIITDITYPRKGINDDTAGLKLCLNIRNIDKNLPILLQSSQLEHKQDAYTFHAGFIYKHSKTLLKDIKDFIKYNFGFGDFVFKEPVTKKEIGRAVSLRDFQHQIKKISDNSFIYHSKRNHFSKWLKARTLFTLADMIEPKSVSDFSSTNDLKLYLFDTIKNYRKFKSKGTISNFNRESFDELSGFSRIGNGSLGGKARGLAFIDLFLKKKRIAYKYQNTTIAIPRTIVLTTDIFEDFMETNDLQKFALSNVSDEKVLTKFLNSKLPDNLKTDLAAILNTIKTPIAVRSSSLLEDSHYQPFAGVYSTYMIANNSENSDIRLKELSDAIKSVFASTYYKNSKAYMLATHNVIDEEKMAVIIQEVSGTTHENMFFPTLSGVARSLNFYPIGNEKAEDGVVNIAIGLGKTIVEGETSLRFSPVHPQKILQLSNVDMALKNTQNKFYSINMDKEFHPTIDEACSLIYDDISKIGKVPGMNYTMSTYDFRNGVLRDGLNYEGKKVATFASILKYDMFPLAKIMKELLDEGSSEMNVPIEIEFAVNLQTTGTQNFNFLQIRPIVEGLENDDINLKNHNKNDIIISSKKSLGHGFYDDLYDFIYVKPETFNPANTKKIAEIIESLNTKLRQEDKNYILVGPGRWGSTDPWLGIPVKWAQISNAKIIVEAGLKNFSIDPSQGSHFFQNITSFRIAYLTINPYINDGTYDLEYLNKIPAIYEDEFIRHLRFEKSLTGKANGKESSAIILKPGSTEIEPDAKL